jgi:MFS family permease
MDRSGTPAAMRRPERQARAATVLVFFLTGAVFAAWSTRLPTVKEQLHLSNGALALAILGLEAGAIVGLPAGGALVTRIGSRAALRASFVAYPLGLVAISLAGGVATLALALAAMALANSVVDVAVNAQGVELERRAGRPLLSGMHAGHSLGLAAGGLAGTLAAAAGVPVRTHFAATAAVGIVAGALATRALVEDRAAGDADGERRFAWPRGPLAVLGVVAFCAFLLDGAGYNWIAVQLRTERGAAPGLAAAAFMLYALMVAAGRLAGDRLVARAGRARVVRASAVLAGTGAVLAVAVPGVPAALGGWALFGLGIAAIAPTVLGAAPNAAPAGMPPAVAIAAVTTVGYLGSFTGPPAIGALAGATGLDTAIGLLAGLAALAMAIGARALRGTSTASGPSPPPR